MIRASVVTHGGKQMICLPDAMAFPEGVREVAIVKAGESLVISLVDKVWGHYFRYGPFASEDFMTERADLDWQERDFSSWDEPQ